MNICQLNTDEKTYNYFLYYAKLIEDEIISHSVFNVDRGLFNIDMRVQKEKIEEHLYLNGFDKSHVECSLDWVNNYAKSFRTWLNTLKLVYIVCKCVSAVQKKSICEITYDDFQVVECTMNDLNGNLLECFFRKI
jgi:hypothetical protein